MKQYRWLVWGLCILFGMDLVGFLLTHGLVLAAALHGVTAVLTWGVFVVGKKSRTNRLFAFDLERRPNTEEETRLATFAGINFFLYLCVAGLSYWWGLE